MDEGLSLKKKVIVDYERYNCYIDIFQVISKGLCVTMIILMAVLGEFSAIVFTTIMD